MKHLTSVLVLACLVAAPAVAGAVTVTIDAFTDYENYVGKAAIADNTPIRISWTTDISSGNYYITLGSAWSSSGGTNQITSGTTSSTSMYADITPSGIKAADSKNGADGEKDVYVTAVADSSSADGGTSGQSGSASIPIHFDTVPPGKPTIGGISGGQNNLKVKLAFSGTADDDKWGFKLYYRKKGDTGDYQATNAFTTTSYTIADLDIGVVYEVRATQLDYAKNESEQTDMVEGEPVPVQDFFEYYRAHGGGDSGGFCFVATAAYGSPAHPFVSVLRDFRDDFLLSTDAGSAFVDWYYAVSPPAAAFVREHGAARFVAGTALLPLVAVAWLLLHPAVPGAALVLAGLALIARRGRARRVLMTIAVVAVGAAIVGVSGPAAAESPRNMALELKFGPYHPSHIDDEAGLNATPYKTIFGAGNHLMSRLQVDYILWDKVGTVCVGGGVGFWQVLGKGRALDPKNPSGPDTKSSDTTVLNIVPFSLDVTYRFDWLAQKKNVPLTPFARVGLDYDIWWVLDGSGSVSSTDNGDSGAGGKIGWHVGGGLGFLLDWIDPDTANDFDVSTGVNNTYLIAEFQYARVDNFGTGGLDLSSESFLFGLLFEF